MRLSAKVAAIEIVGDEVRAAVVKTGSRLPKVLALEAERAVYTAPEDRNEALIAATKAVVARLGVKASAYVLCAGSQHSVVRILRIALRRSRVASAVPFELEPYLAIPIENLVIDHSIIREHDGQTEVLVVGMRRETIEAQLAILSAAGIEADGVSIDATGLMALWQPTKIAGATLRAVMHVREEGSIIGVFHQKTLAFFRHVPVSAEELRRDPAAAARHAQNSLRAFTSSWQGDDEIADLTVTGLDLDHEALRIFEEGLSVPCTFQDLLASLSGPGLAKRAMTAEPAGETPGGGGWPGYPEQGQAEAHPTMAPQTPANYWEAAIGVATAAAGGTPAFEFRQGELAGAASARSLLRHAAFSAVLTALLIGVYALYCRLDYSRNVAEIDRMGVEVWNLFVEAFPEAPAVQAGPDTADAGGAKAFGAMQEAASSLAALETADLASWLNRPTLLDILLEISRRLPGSKLAVTKIQVKPSEDASQRITITGEVKDTAAFSEAFESLKQSTLIRVDEDPMRSLDKGVETFTITASTQENKAWQN